MRLPGKLALTLVTLSVVTATVSGAIIYDRARNVLERLALEKLQAIRQARTEFVVTYLDFLETHCSNFSRNPLLVNATVEFVQGYDELRTKKLTPAQEGRLRTFYEEEYLPVANRFTEEPTPLELLFPVGDAARYVQFKYIAENPHPLDSKHLLIEVDDGSKYARAHARYQKNFDDFREELGYLDMLLVHPETDEIVYSVHKETDLGSNLDHGFLARSKLASAVRRIRDKKTPGEVEFVDFEPWAPSYWRPSMFVITGVFQDGTLRGVLVLQIPDKLLSRVVGVDSALDPKELGRTGEVFLIGPDYLMRSESRFLMRDGDAYLDRLRRSGFDQSMVDRIERTGTAIMALRRRSEIARMAFEGDEGTRKANGSFDQGVITSFDRFEPSRLSWAIVAQMDIAESTAWLAEFRTQVIASLAIACLLACAVAYFAARALVRPLQQVNRAARAFTNGFFEVRLPVHSNDEFADLARTFNNMAAEIESKTTRLKTVIEDTNRLLEHMMPPLVMARFRRREGAEDSTPFGTEITLAFVEFKESDRLFDFFESRIALDLFDELIASFDEACQRLGLEKLGNSGTGHMVACGLTAQRFDHTTRVLAFAQELQWIVDTFNAQHLTSIYLNIGVHRTPITTGRLGRMHFVKEGWKRTIELAKEIDPTVRKSGVRVSREAFLRAEGNAEFEFTEDEISSGEPAWTLVGFSGKRFVDA